ncbi:MAG TPA: arginine deiminase family protein [Allosphingosinicella sp.]|jgi:N-dimethylarginine dimethylaminohydrolase
MLYDFPPADASVGDSLVTPRGPARWGADSEYGRLTDVMLAAPRHLELVPCNAVSIENHRNGIVCSPDLAAEQHRKLVAALEAEGVRCHLVPPVEGLADLSFTRDSTMISPWGLIALSPAVEHRLAEVAHIREAVAGWDVPLVGGVEEGRVEGGDVCLRRPGLVAIGYSGERTDETGALSLARTFEERGWRSILTRFDKRFLHLDTIFTLAGPNLAIACTDALDELFLLEMQELGIEIIDVTVAEVQKLSANLLSLGDRRVMSPAENHRVNALLERRGYKVVRVAIDQFTRCGGGVHCLTMPLARLPG